MKTIKLILKGILFYTTLFFIFFFISIIDRLANEGILYIIVPIIILTFLGFFFCTITTERELEKITGYNLFKGKIQ